MLPKDVEIPDSTEPAEWLRGKFSDWPTEGPVHLDATFPPVFHHRVLIHHPFYDSARRAVRFVDLSSETVPPLSRGALEAYLNSGRTGSESVRPPLAGSLPLEVERPLNELLDIHHPDSPVWAAIWVGYSGLPGWLLKGPTVQLGARKFHLLRVDRHKICEFPAGPFHQSASFWWPTSRSYLVGTDIDESASIVGTDSFALVQAILDSTQFDAELVTDAADG